MVTTNQEQDAQLQRANQVLQSLAGEDVDAIDVRSVESSEATFLAKIVSKLSPMVGNLMEQRIVRLLDEHAEGGYSWRRQDPGFPDAILVDPRGNVTETGYEIKAWYVLSTEITGRFKESQRLLADRNINVVIVAWCMSHLIFGKPKILGVLTVSGMELAQSRDFHYHQPPEYLIIEPNDTTGRTANLQQSNVNGYKLQEATSSDALLREERSRWRRQPFTGNPSSEEAQEDAIELMASLSYRLDTNFAKIDRVANRHIEEFKARILREKYLGKTIAQWKTLFTDLNGSGLFRRIQAEGIITDLYAGMLHEEPKTEIVVESEDAR